MAGVYDPRRPWTATVRVRPVTGASVNMRRCERARRDPGAAVRTYHEGPNSTSKPELPLGLGMEAFYLAPTPLNASACAGSRLAALGSWRKHSSAREDDPGANPSQCGGVYSRAMDTSDSRSSLERSMPNGLFRGIEGQGATCVIVFPNRNTRFHLCRVTGDAIARPSPRPLPGRKGDGSSPGSAPPGTRRPGVWLGRRRAWGRRGHEPAGR